MGEEDRKLQGTTDIAEWGKRMLNFVEQVGEVQSMSDVSDADKATIQQAADKIRDLFIKVSEVSASNLNSPDFNERLIASHDRMREELDKANKLLAQILATR